MNIRIEKLPYAVPGTPRRVCSRRVGANKERSCPDPVVTWEVNGHKFCPKHAREYVFKLVLQEQEVTA